MKKTMILVASLLMLAAAATPAAQATHAPSWWPEENASCVYNAFTGWVCVLSDTGWCWIFWHCPLDAEAAPSEVSVPA